MQSSRGKFGLLIAVVVLLATMPLQAAAAATTGTVTGRVLVPPAQAGSLVDVDAYSFDVADNAWKAVAAAQTTTNGRYSMVNVPAGAIKVLFAGRGHLHPGYEPEWCRNRTTIYDSVPVAVRAGKTTSGIDAQLADDPTLSGTVTSTGGEPLSGVNVSLRIVPEDDGGPGEQDTQTDASGHFGFKNMPAGSYQLFFDGSSVGPYAPACYPSCDAGDTFAILPGEDVGGVDVQLASECVQLCLAAATGSSREDDGERVDQLAAGTASISGHVTGPMGDDIEDIVDVAVFRKDDDTGSYVSVAGGPVHDDGRYEVTELAAGTYKVRIDGDPLVPWLSYFYVDRWWLDADAEANADEIVLDDGEAFAGADVQLAPKPVSFPGIDFLTPPVISGTPHIGRTLTAGTGTWTSTGLAYRYQWRRDSAAITGATGRSYTLTAADRGKDIDVVVVATKALHTDGTGLSSALRAKAVPTVTLTGKSKHRHWATLIAMVAVPGVSDPGGRVKFRSHGKTLGKVALQDGRAKLKLKGLTSGWKTFRAVYLGTSGTIPGADRIRLRIR